MRHHRPPMPTPQPRGTWALLAMLAVAVLAPTAGVLWFMGEAVRNERLAVRQRLTDAYRRDVEAIRRRLLVYWQRKVDALAALDAAAYDEDDPGRRGPGEKGSLSPQTP